MHIRCPHCHHPVDLVEEVPLGDVTCPSCGSHFSLLGDRTASYRPGEARTIVYIVSDLVRGATLADWLTGQRLTPREAAQLCVTIAAALQHAHDAGVIHRDLKPSNIMIGSRACIENDRRGFGQRLYSALPIELRRGKRELRRRESNPQPLAYEHVLQSGSRSLFRRRRAIGRPSHVSTQRAQRGDCRDLTAALTGCWTGGSGHSINFSWRRRPITDRVAPASLP